jgi:hypothetical protein
MNTSKQAFSRKGRRGKSARFQQHAELTNVIGTK